MRILMADDDRVARLRRQGLRGSEVVAASDGTEAWELLQADDRPRLAILDGMMPEPDGLEVCRRARQGPGLQDLYHHPAHGQGGEGHLLEGLRAGANDYRTKPFAAEELKARPQVVLLRAELAAAQARLQQLQALVAPAAHADPLRDGRKA